mgnify:CR=1 FL=1
MDEQRSYHRSVSCTMASGAVVKGNPVVPNACACRQITFGDSAANLKQVEQWYKERDALLDRRGRFLLFVLGIATAYLVGQIVLLVLR